MLAISFSLLFACRSAKVQLDETSSDETSSEEPDWWESGEDDSTNSSDSDEGQEGQPDDTGDKPEDEEFDDEKDSGLGDTQDCGDDFDPTASCEGDWTTTLCMHDGLYWWCEGGVWINEEDKS